MSSLRVLPWTRILAEGFAIVVGILLAFSIDAWWQQRSDLEKARVLMQGLQADFESSQRHLEMWLAGNIRIRKALTDFLAEIHSTVDEIDSILVDAVHLAWLAAAVGTPTYNPTESTLRAAISSGQIELLLDVKLRNLLAVWGQQVDDTREDELMVRNVVSGTVVPLLSERVRLAAAFDFDSMTGWFGNQPGMDLDEPYQVLVDSRLEGAVAERLFYTNFVVIGLSDIRKTQAAILRELEAQLAAD